MTLCIFIQWNAQKLEVMLVCIMSTARMMDESSNVATTAFHGAPDPCVCMCVCVYSVYLCTCKHIFWGNAPTSLYYETKIPKGEMAAAIG